MSGVLITGATGFIGCRFAELRKQRGMHVRAIGLTTSKIEEQRGRALTKLGVDLTVASLDDLDAIDRSLDDVSTVIHLAAAQHEANVSESYFHDVNVDATRALLGRCEKLGVENFFYASSIGVYGETNGTKVTSRSQVQPDNCYGRSKLAAEQALAQHDGAVRIFIGRIGETYGPWDWRLHKLFAGIARRRFVIAGQGNNLHQPIYVDNLSDAVDQLLQTQTLSGVPIVLCGDEAITTREMCNSIADAVEKSIPSWRVPMWPLLAGAIGMEMTLGRFGIQPPLHRRRLDFFRKSLSFCTNQRKNLLNLAPQVSFAEGSKRTLCWYKRHNWL